VIFGYLRVPQWRPTNLIGIGGAHGRRRRPAAAFNDDRAFCWVQAHPPAGLRGPREPSMTTEHSARYRPADLQRDEHDARSAARPNAYRIDGRVLRLASFIRTSTSIRIIMRAIGIPLKMFTAVFAIAQSWLARAIEGNDRRSGSANRPAAPTSIRDRRPASRFRSISVRRERPANTPS
jgi:hypothetical protein